MTVKTNGSEPTQIQMFDLPDEVDNSNYSVKSDSLAQAILGKHIKIVYKRVFEGLLSQIKSVNIREFIEMDKPLLVNLSPAEYKAMFPRDSRIETIFKEAARYYSKNTTLEIPNDDDPDNPVFINVVDKAHILPSGEIEVLFTRSILPHLDEVKDRLLVLDIRDFAALSSKYSQKLFELFTSWKDTINTQVSVEKLKQILSVPDSYSTSRFCSLALDVAINEINEETSLIVSYEKKKGNRGKAIKYLVFTIYEKQDDNPSLSLEGLEENSKFPGLINTFKTSGIKDEVFFTVAEIRRDQEKPKPTNQESMNAYFRKVIEIAKRSDTMP
ncbi:MAG: replication initiation protein, partial [Campylobacterales bacterium]|nr:replication initiation protein [Campylobacterales bacterium]